MDEELVFVPAPVPLPLPELINFQLCAFAIFVSMATILNINSRPYLLKDNL